MSFPTLSQFLDYLITGSTTNMTPLISDLDPYGKLYSSLSTELANVQTLIANSAWSSFSAFDISITNDVVQTYNACLSLTNWS